jgi:dihydroorotase
MELERIDPHVHLRDEEWSYKYTIRRGLRDAEQQGIGMVFDMPNLPRPVIDGRRVRERLGLVPKPERERYRLWVGITSEPNQIKKAVNCWNEFEEVIGLKMFAGGSIELGVIEERSQRLVYQALVESGYEGVLAVHCEKEAYINPRLFDPRHPETWSKARPKMAELESIRDQIRLAVESGFRGTLYVCHVSCPEAVELINQAKRRGIGVVAEVTPHHLLWSTDRMKEANGLFYKCNPSLRDEEVRKELLGRVRRGEIDILGTDHAPHSLLEKFTKPYSSGIPSLFWYRRFVEEIMPQEWGLSQRIIEDMIMRNVERIFKGKLS